MDLDETPPLAGDDRITLGEWMYDEKEEPELSQQDAWRPQTSPREPGQLGDPFFVTRELLHNSHTHIRGKTGSGKSSRLVYPMASQLLRPYRRRWTDADGVAHEQTDRDAIIVVDLGGDLANFHSLKEESESQGRDFRWVALDANRSQTFDPFQSIPEDGYRIIRLCNLFLEAFSLDHGLAYGGSWYSQRNLLLLLSICERLIAKKRGGGDITLREVDRYLQDPQTANIRDAEQIRGIFRFLLEYPQLQPTPSDKSVVNLREAIENREVVYAFLPSIAEATTARQIAGLILYTAVNAAMQIYERGERRDGPQPHVHIFVDEFHTLAGAAFESLLTGARKYSLSLHLANQTSESLVTRDLDLRSVVRDNCGVKLYQTVTGKQDIDELLTFSRETTRTMRSTKQKESVRVKGKSALGGSSESEQVTTQLSKSEVLGISATAGGCLAIVEDGLGHREPIPLLTRHWLPQETYLRRKSTPLPETNRQTLHVPGRVRLSMPAWKEAHFSPNKDETHRQRLVRLTALRDKLVAEEQEVVEDDS